MSLNAPYWNPVMNLNERKKIVPLRYIVSIMNSLQPMHCYHFNLSCFQFCKDEFLIIWSESAGLLWYRSFHTDCKRTEQCSVMLKAQYGFLLGWLAQVWNQVAKRLMTLTQHHHMIFEQPIIINWFLYFSIQLITPGI